MGALQRRIEPERRTRVGPGDDLEIPVAARVDRGPDLAEHLRQGHDLLPVEMAAALREDLVLELDPRRAGALQHSDRADHVERVAEARVGVDEERDRDRVGHGRDMVHDLGKRGEPDVGRAEMHVGDAGARDVAGLEAEILHDAREQRVGSAGEEGSVAPRQD
jgi:hypothetical protein